MLKLKGAREGINAVCDFYKRKARTNEKINWLLFKSESSSKTDGQSG